MNPRRQTKQKWTPFPAELTEQIRQVFQQNFATQLGKTTKVNVLGKIFTQEICLRVGLNKKGELKNQNFEVSVDHSGEQDNVVSQIHICVDALAGLVQEYYDNDEDIELPYTWAELPMSNHKVFVQYTSENPDLEAQANTLLGEQKGDALLNEYEGVPDVEGEGELTDEIAEEISSGPTIFSGKGSGQATGKTTNGKKKKKEDLH